MPLFVKSGAKTSINMGDVKKVPKREQRRNQKWQSSLFLYSKGTKYEKGIKKHILKRPTPKISFFST